MTADTKTHLYQIQLQWTGNTGTGTANYRGYERSHEITADGKPSIPGSSDPAFRGDNTRYNPEELLLASLSACHMLWYLHLSVDAQIIVINYIDHPVGTMIETHDGGGRFTEVILKPVVTVATGSNLELVEQLHEQAHRLCFIANSMNFSVRCEPSVLENH